MASSAATAVDSLALFKTKVSSSAVYGVAIAATSVLVATIASSAIPTGEISLGGIIAIQRDNVALWVLDLMPFIYAFWGQRVTRSVTNEANAVVNHQTSKLRLQAEVLQHEIQQIARLDSLTGLFNRRQIHHYLERRIHDPINNVDCVGLIVFDLDGFADINNALGHNKGDMLLKQVALRLQEHFHDAAMIARLGGDEFAILMSGHIDTRVIEAYADRIHSILVAPFKLDDIGFHLRARIGAAMFPDHGRDGAMIMQNADIALNASKHNKVKHTVFTPCLNQQNHDRLMLKTDFYKALEKNELCLHYQPKIDRADKVVEVEALVRWFHPVKGLITPERFVPFVEKSGLNQELLCWVLKNALDQARHWQASGIAIGIAVNLSALDLLDDELPSTIRNLLEQSQLPPHFLKLEITETTSLIDQEKALTVLSRMAEMGVPISLDDFGTGYSSLTYLTQLPAEEVKIDQSFVLNMDKDHHNQEIVRAMIDLAHNLSMRVVAEGVDSESTKQRLLSYGCDMLQGFHISRPLDARAFQKWLENWNRVTTHVSEFVH